MAILNKMAVQVEMAFQAATVKQTSQAWESYRNVLRAYRIQSAIVAGN